jgi:hypothetical protein
MRTLAIKTIISASKINEKKTELVFAYSKSRKQTNKFILVKIYNLYMAVL